MIAENGYTHAVTVLRECATAHGFYASAHGYTAVWSRDSMITSLGASLVRDSRMRRAFRQSLISLAKHQSKMGEIPNNVDLWDKRRKKQVTFASIDSTLWWLIGMQVYAKRYHDRSLLRRFQGKMGGALRWVQYQDAGSDGLPEQQPTTDWMDAFPHKYGHVLNTQALYYAALRLMGKGAAARKVKELVNGKVRKDLNLFDRTRGYYLPYIWKSHDGIREQESWFDALGNLLAVVFGLANRGQALRILAHIKKRRINLPYPVKALDPPFRPGKAGWHPYFAKSDARIPRHYLNGGIWLYIGGFYVLALVQCGRRKEAEQELEKMAAGLLRGNSPEWLDGKTGKPHGEWQAWNAGMYVLAYEGVKRGRAAL
ncbi:MAG TPA: glycoside hydrolase 100 family protein [Candidatus Nanoarchaeia archaeon]|nr:glycoside hydrolase 100 family protein [Candidatus Nanoarchaeia archaeon]